MICVADPEARRIRWFVREGAAYSGTAAGGLLPVASADPEAAVDWP